MGFELAAEFGVGDPDHGFDALADGLAVEIRDSMLRDHVVDIAARGHHAGTGTEHGHDAGDYAVLRSRRQGDDGQAAFGARGATEEIDLSADAGVGRTAHGIGTYLAGEI